MTFYHLLEVTMGDAFSVPVWLEKTYSMPCVDEDDQHCIVPVRAFDPVVAECRIDHKARADLRAFFAAEFERAGLKRNGPAGSAQSWVIPAREFLDHLRALARQGITIYSTTEELAASKPYRAG